MFQGYLLYLDSFSFSLPIYFFLVVVTTTVISSGKKNIYVYLFSKELYTFIIQNFVYTSFASQKFVYTFLKSMSFLKMGLVWMFSCQNFDGSIILFYTKGSVSTS